MNICITGALGHIGSKLIRSLDASLIKRVHLVDNLYKQRYYSLVDLPKNIQFVFHEMDILSQKLDEIIRDSDVVIHLAAISDVESSFQDAKEVKRVNVDGLAFVAKLCASYHKPLLFPSTTSVYSLSGDNLTENSPKSYLKPTNPYAKSKLFGERYLKSLSQKEKFNFVVLRFGTIFGYSVGMRFNTAVNKFAYQALSNQDITVWKTAYDQKRPYCDLDDCVNAINHVLKNNLFDNQIYNIVSSNLTVRNIIDALKRYIPDLKISFVESRVMNTLSYEVSNQKSQEKGFLYGGNLDQKVREFAQVFQNINAFVKKQNI